MAVPRPPVVTTGPASKAPMHPHPPVAGVLTEPLAKTQRSPYPSTGSTPVHFVHEVNPLPPFTPLRPLLSSFLLILCAHCVSVVQFSAVGRFPDLPTKPRPMTARSPHPCPLLVSFRSLQSFLSSQFSVPSVARKRAMLRAFLIEEATRRACERDGPKLSAGASCAFVLRYHWVQSSTKNLVAAEGQVGMDL